MDFISRTSGSIFLNDPFLGKLLVNKLSSDNQSDGQSADIRIHAEDSWFTA